MYLREIRKENDRFCVSALPLLIIVVLHSGEFKGRGAAVGRLPPYWLIFFVKKPLFPCKRHIFRCVHLR